MTRTAPLPDCPHGWAEASCPHCAREAQMKARIKELVDGVEKALMTAKFFDYESIVEILYPLIYEDPK